MKLQNIMIADCKQSATNAQGRCEGKEFDELVASIKEKGVLVPVLARAMTGKDKIGKWEVVAGNRRLAAAKVAGLESIPAQIVEMNDVEAREAQIVENLQRQDIHPLDEGEAYRQLKEKSRPHYETKDIALKVGKSETYVRQRLALTNLIEKAKQSFRAGKLLISQAIIICRLENDKQQADALKQAVDYGWDAERLKEWIEERVYLDLAGKPWAKDAKLAEMVGDMSAKPENLFGDKALGNDPVAISKQMAAYIEIKLREAQSKGEKLVRISSAYGTPDLKGVLGRDEYRVVTSKDKDVKKIKGIVVEGDKRGQILTITTDKEVVRGQEVYKQTAAEKAKRKKEHEAEKKKQENKIKMFKEAIEKIKWPLSKKQLDALFNFALNSRGVSVQQPVVKFLGIEIVRKEETRGWETKKKVMVADYEASLRKYADENGDVGKLRIVFALLISHPGNEWDDGKGFKHDSSLI